MEHFDDNTEVSCNKTCDNSANPSCAQKEYTKEANMVCKLFTRNAAVNINHYNKTVGTHIQRLKIKA